MYNTNSFQLPSLTIENKTNQVNMFCGLQMSYVLLRDPHDHTRDPHDHTRGPHDPLESLHGSHGTGPPRPPSDPESCRRSRHKWTTNECSCSTAARGCCTITGTVRAYNNINNNNIKRSLITINLIKRFQFLFLRVVKLKKKIKSLYLIHFNHNISIW